MGFWAWLGIYMLSVVVAHVVYIFISAYNNYETYEGKISKVVYDEDDGLTWESGAWVMYIPVLGFLLIVGVGVVLILRYLKNKWFADGWDNTAEWINNHNPNIKFPKSKVAFQNPINWILRKMLKTRYLLNRVSEEV